MTNEEFRRWFRMHCEGFPSVHSWLGNYPKEPSEDRPSQKGILTTWRETLESQTLEDCLAVSRELHSGQTDPPKLIEDHARHVRRLAGERRAKRQAATFTAQPRSREVAYRCLTCFDTGMVQCWHPDAMKAAREGGTNRYKCAVRCSCSAGQKYAWQKCVYDPEKWILTTGNYEQNQKDLLAWAENYVAVPPYDFGEYNA